LAAIKINFYQQYLYILVIPLVIVPLHFSWSSDSNCFNKCLEISNWDRADYWENSMKI